MGTRWNDRAARSQAFRDESDSFHDCVLGPDGWLYVANGTSILRLNVNPEAEGDLDSCSR